MKKCLPNLMHLNTHLVAGYWKTNQNVTLGLFNFMAQLIATLIHYPCTVTLTTLADWSAFLELVLLTM